MIIDVTIVIEIILIYHLWVNVDLDLLYERQAWIQSKVRTRLVILHRVAKVKIGHNMSN